MGKLIDCDGNGLAGADGARSAQRDSEEPSEGGQEAGKHLPGRGSSLR